ncbi:MAG: site-specific DNA-methyltransferase [Candidatus Melainabacteria bacterium]|nr:site-specific DNA-methyltransferase [Candidatus Melainabacteria bacterium]
MSSRSRELQKQPISKKLLFGESANFENQSAHFCMPLHMVPADLRELVLKEPRQIAEWQELFPSEFSTETEATTFARQQALQSDSESSVYVRAQEFETIVAEHVPAVQNASDTSSATSAHLFQNWRKASSLPVDTRLLSDELSERIRNSFIENELSGLLVHSDNAAFLKSAGAELSEQVRLIYMDPPYNTGNTNFAYKDDFERSDWLAMMRNLLVQLLPMLASNGSICISIDDSEMPYLRILLDEIVGEKNFVACIAYERSGSAGLGQGGVILNTKEYILVYSLDKRALNDLGRERPLDKETMRRYSKVLIDEGTRTLIDEIETAGQHARLYRHEGVRISSLSLRTFEARRDEIDAQFIESFEKIFRTQNVQKENSFQNSIITRLKKDEFYSMEYIPSRGKYKGSDKTLYYWNGELCAWLKDSAFVTANGITKRNKLTDFWSHAEIPKADLANEGGVLFSRSKKPEHLMHRLIALTTDKGDLVLDPFLGSGSTAAVAHKMARRWIGIESGQHFFDGPLSRLKRVLGGEQSGVSHLTTWQGGGIFKYYPVKEGRKSTLPSKILD